MKKISLDTNAVLRFLLNDVSSQHKKVKTLVTKASRKEIALNIPEIVVFETIFALTTYYGFDKNRVIDAVETITSAHYLDVENRKFFLEGINLFRQSKVEFVDCFLVAKCTHGGYELFSFDKKLLKLINSL
ncbi:PIN domain-containing protein [Patescibacteria group bacterium]